jgi:hypothetical protein
MTTTAKPATCIYTVDQQVEVLCHDFSQPGFPQVWTRGVVVSVEPIGDAGHWNVNVQVGPTAWKPQIVGRRGGNRNIRPAGGTA